MALAFLRIADVSVRDDHRDSALAKARTALEMIRRFEGLTGVVAQREIRAKAGELEAGLNTFQTSPLPTPQLDTQFMKTPTPTR